MLCEILIKACKCKFESPLLNYFGFKNGEGICNGITFDNNYSIFAIAAVGFEQLINWNYKLHDTNDYILFQANDTTINNIRFVYKDKQLKLFGIIMIKEIETWLIELKDHFDTIDNSFALNNGKEIQLASSLIILIVSSPNNNVIKINNEKERTIISIGDEIYAINSNLSFISNEHFSLSYSKGYISNKLTKNIYLIDIRGIPNMLMSMIYNMTNQEEIMIIFTVLNISNSYTPLIFGFRIDELKTLVISAMNPLLNPVIIPQKISSFSLPDYIEAVYLIHDLNQSATCFHIGNGIILTNKHFFTHTNTNSNTLYTITNQYHSFQCKYYFIPDNSFDIALVKIYNQTTIFISTLPYIPIESEDYSIKPLHEFHLYQYSIFPKQIFLCQSTMPNRTRGCISKTVKYKGKPILYQLDSCCYNGASGSPVISNITNKLIGVVYQNISINNIQLPNISFAIAKDILKEIHHCMSDIEKLRNIWIFHIPHEDIDHTIFLSLYKSKL